MVGTAREFLFVTGDTCPTLPSSRAKGRNMLACCFPDWPIPLPECPTPWPLTPHTERSASSCMSSLVPIWEESVLSALHGRGIYFRVLALCRLLRPGSHSRLLFLSGRSGLCTHTLESAGDFTI